MRNLHSQSTQEAELRLTPQLQAAGEAGPANGSVHWEGEATGKSAEGSGFSSLCTVLSQTIDEMWR